jgi:hypothetical protein
MNATTFLFVKFDDGQATVKLTKDLYDFNSFCHYFHTDDWLKNKKGIEDCLEKGYPYVFDGNDVHYYILTHPFWQAFTDEESGEKYEAAEVELKVV